MILAVDKLNLKLVCVSSYIWTKLISKRVAKYFSPVFILVPAYFVFVAGLAGLTDLHCEFRRSKVK